MKLIICSEVPRPSCPVVVVSAAPVPTRPKPLVTVLGVTRLRGGLSGGNGGFGGLEIVIGGTSWPASGPTNVMSNCCGPVGGGQPGFCSPPTMTRSCGVTEPTSKSSADCKMACIEPGVLL